MVVSINRVTDLVINRYDILRLIMALSYYALLVRLDDNLKSNIIN